MRELRMSPAYRDYQRAFEAATGLPLSLSDTSRPEAPLGDSTRRNPFCASLAGRSRTCSACLELQQRIQGAGGEQPATAQCFAGLNESAIPVRIGRRVIGHLRTGQVFFRRPSPARLRRLAEILTAGGADAEFGELQQSFLRTRIVARPHYDSLLIHLSAFARHLSLVANQLAIGQPADGASAIAQAQRFIAAHHAEPIPLARVARAVNLSSFHFCKLFKRGTGQNFSDYLARVRVEAVKRDLLDARRPVREAAAAAGFRSLSQFNRIFARVTGETPSDFRRRLRMSLA
jgi:AraC-like DNA-binding protein